MSIAEIDVKIVCDIVAGVKIGQAYVIDAQGRLIAHPDISMVVRNSDMMHFAHLQAARTAGARGGEQVQEPGTFMATTCSSLTRRWCRPAG